MFENRVLRRIVGPKRDEVTESWRNFHNEELHNLYSSLSINRMMNSRRMKWMTHVAHVGVMNSKCWWGSLKERDHSKDLGKDGRIY
jgi:hypothetical protein